MTDDWGDPDPNRAWRPGTEPAAAPAAPTDQYSYFPPPHLAVPPWEPPPYVPLRRRARQPLATYGLTVAVLVLLGAPLALLWRAVAPTAVVLRTASGPRPEAPESSQVFATDGWFVVVSLVAGVVLGVAAWFVLRRRGAATAFGIATGGLLASLVAAAVGRRMVVDQYLYDFCHRADVQCLVYDGTLRLHALAAVVVLPVAMLTAFAGMTFFLERD